MSRCGTAFIPAMAGGQQKFREAVKQKFQLRVAVSTAKSVSNFNL